MMGPPRGKQARKGYSKPTAASTSRSVVKSSYDQGGVYPPQTYRGGDVYNMEPVYRRFEDSSGQEILSEMLERHAVDQWQARKREFDKDRLLDELLLRRYEGMAMMGGHRGAPGMHTMHAPQQYHYVTSSGSAYNEEVYHNRANGHHSYHAGAYTQRQHAPEDMMYNPDPIYMQHPETIDRDIPSHVSQLSDSYRSGVLSSSGGGRAVPASSVDAPPPPPVMTRKVSHISSSHSSASVSRKGSEESVVKSGGSLSPNRDAGHRHSSPKKVSKSKRAAHNIPEESSEEEVPRKSKSRSHKDKESKHSKTRNPKNTADSEDDTIQGARRVVSEGEPENDSDAKHESDSSSYEMVRVRKKKAPKERTVTRKASKETNATSNSMVSVGVSGTTASITEDTDGEGPVKKTMEQQTSFKALDANTVEVPKHSFHLKRADQRTRGGVDGDGVIIPALKGSRPVLSHNGEMLDADEIMNASYAVLAREIFKRYDRDGDGVLNKFEYTLLMMDIAYDLKASDNFTTGVELTRLSSTMTPSRASAFRRLLLAPPIGSFVTIEGCSAKAKINGFRGKVRAVRRDGLVEVNLAGGVKQYLNPSNLIWED
eukprot:TRINITY_DN2489_c0_g1_i4.p1 TRINITY_DN2489_c0_g1~~TRINITY_DN2489_c0_g1_i4.p1  ORF type:complete len:597 (+),score=223.48 TRINITY_DN2489_c0_g1_i4:53-1843(+)